MLLGGKVELPRTLAPHVTAAWNRLAVHIVGDVAGFPTGLAKLVSHFAIFVQCGHLRHKERADAVRLMCQYFPFNPPASVMATFEAAVVSRRAQGAADAAAAAAPPATSTPELSADDLADNGMTGGADDTMAGADEAGNADVTMAEASEGALTGAQSAAQFGGGGQPAPGRAAVRAGTAQVMRGLGAEQARARRRPPDPPPPLDPDRAVDASPGRGGDDAAERAILRAAVRAFAEGDKIAANRLAGSCARTCKVFRDSPMFHTALALFPSVRAGEEEARRSRPNKAAPAITLDTLNAVLEKVSMRSAPGCSGMTFRVVKLLVDNGSDVGRLAILRVLNAIAGGCSTDRGVLAGVEGVESWFSAAFRTSRLILLPKPDGQLSVRPIGIGEAFYRITARALLMLAGTTRINAALLPGQFGVGSQGGVEPPIHLQRYLARDLNFTKVDYKNAFNSVDINAVINEVRADFPEMDPFVTWAYGTPSMLLLRLADFSVAVVLSGRGVRQGCPLSPLLFSLVMRRIIRAIAEALHDRVVAGSRRIGAPLGDARAFLDPAQAGALVLAYLDDIHVQTRTLEDDRIAKGAARSAAALVGLTMHETKTVAVDTVALLREGRAVGLLGGHIGHPDAVSAALIRAVEAMEPTFERFARWLAHGHALMVLTLLRTCSVPSKAHIARCEVPSQSRAAQVLFERRVLSLLRMAVGEGRLSAESELLATLPMDLGGVGFESLAAHQPGAGFGYAASVLLSSAMLRARGIELDVNRLPEAAESVQRGVDNLSLPPADNIFSWPADKFRGVQARMSERFHISRFVPLVSRLLEHPTPQNQIWLSRLRENASKTAHGWMHAGTPGPFRARLTEQAVVFAYRRWLLLPMFAGPSACNCRCGVALRREDPFCAASIAGTGPRFGLPAGWERLNEDPNGSQTEAQAEEAVFAAEARAAVATGTAVLRLRPEGSHALRCKRAQGRRTERSAAIVHALGAKFKSMGETVFYESASGAGLKRSDYFRLLSGRHFDVGVYSLDEIVQFPPLQLGAGGVGSPTVRTATQQAAWRAWIVEADKVCFGALTRAAALKVKDHSPATVIPVIFSAGGALRACDNDLLPEPEDRNGRHWMRVELGTIMMKFAFEISVQLWSPL